MVLGVVLMVLEVSPGREAPGKKPQVLRTPLGSKNPGPPLVAPLGPGLKTVFWLVLALQGSDLDGSWWK